MQALWTRYETWLKQNWPDALAALNPPASDLDLAMLQQALQAPLPADYVASLKIHNGERHFPPCGLFRRDQYLPVESVLSQWTSWKGLSDEGVFDEITSDGGSTVSSRWWDTGWIPFSHDGMGNSLCIDTAPAENGTAGQIIRMWHDDADRPVEATDFRSWFADLVEGVETGKYVYSPEWGILTPAMLARLGRRTGAH